MSQSIRDPILPRIDGPSDLQGLSREELEILAGELRQFILEKLSPVGGHLASSLGVVELTVALHAVFRSPEDRIIWDVGHQAYPHKILTGRRDRFATIRQKGGLSGFPKRSESPHDAFGTGHSSTSISAGLGMAVARDLLGRERRVVAVIGDGSMTAGLAFEGLNHAGGLDRGLVVVLNDNEMSISPNVGALSSYLSRILTGDLYSRFRRDVEEVLKAIPSVGGAMAKLAKRVEEHIKGFFSPGMLFEELGFTYVGPIDGHNLGHLVTAFQNVRKFDKPVLVHVVTQKGRGFTPAEESPAAYHGVGPFDPCNGVCSVSGSPVPSYTRVFSDTLLALAENDPRIVAITAAMPEGTGLDRFHDRFPDRFFDVGIAEQHAVTFAAGLAAEGLVPVVAMYSTFLQRAYDQVVHDVALQGLPVILALDRAGLVGADGPTHHGSFDLSLLRHVPDLVLLAPADENELRHALATAVELGRPVAVRYPRGCGTGCSLDGPPERLPLGKGRLVSGSAEDPGVLVLSCGTLLEPALEAAALASKKGVQASVFDVRYVKPLDAGAILSLARRATGVVTLEENALAGGFGSAVLELFAEADGEFPTTRRLGLPDRFVEHGTQAELRAELGLDAPGICRAIVALGDQDRGVRGERLDQLLVERGLAPSREKAKALVLAGQVVVGEHRVNKPGVRVDPDQPIRLKREITPYVSRGALKLEAALAEFGVNPDGRTCVDVGASTGGFTDCLVQAGARRVYAVDVGYGQLAWKLQQNPRVVAIERVNVRHMPRERIPEAVDLVVVDASFISLRLLLPKIWELLDPAGDSVVLVKPQFEVGRGRVGKGGVVRDPAQRESALNAVLDSARAIGFAVVGTMESPVPGAKRGNVEYLAHLRRDGGGRERE